MTTNTGSEIPEHTPLVPTLTDSVIISEEKILKIMRSLNPIKKHGWDEISVRMIKLNDNALVVPIKDNIHELSSMWCFPLNMEAC